MLKNVVTLQELARLNAEDAVKHVGFIFEESPWVVREVFTQQGNSTKYSTLFWQFITHWSRASEFDSGRNS